MFLATAREATAFFYALCDLFCASIIGILLYTTLTDVDRTNKRIHLIAVLITVIVYCISDSLWIFSYCNFIIPCTRVPRYITSIIKYIIISGCSYTICRFFFSIWESVVGSRKRRSKTIFLPIVILVLAVITTPFTHLIFEINNFGFMLKGPLYQLFTTVLFGYLIVFSIFSVIFYFQTENDFAKEQYSFVLIYTIPALFGAYIHYHHWTIPSFAIGFTFATLIIYIFQMRDMVSLDALTGINNRRQGERFFMEQISRINEEPHQLMECLFLFMMDLNKFKAINDNYGHAEGDKALIATSEVLKEACSHIRRRCILSRFGGDEFVIGVVFTPDEAHLLNEKINELIIKKNEELNTPYKISISVGYTYYKKEFRDLRTFLSKADKIMYEMKEAAHKREAEEKSLEKKE
ncbi:GGDEF domain-containing protein [uncultured Treponema sp.]|uniref:GGDEF domain-containing protein n=1 Tax=uncultured Treponema sp. TaxID=162155 RepID=UPI0025E56D7B|nr:GGDEF domain-containing protein [uncultured Treponema sp.]